nr:hypothetical protein [uncultured bacterium]
MFTRSGQLFLLAVMIHAPFVARCSCLVASLSGVRRGDEMTQIRYDVAISFAGEDRVIAEEIATKLLARRYSVFYDRFEQHKLWGEDLGGRLSDVYSEQSRYCVIVVSHNYANKVWTRLEFSSAVAGAIFGDSRDAYVLPLRLDDTKLSGLRPTVGYLDLRLLDVPEVVDLLVRKIGPPMDAVEHDTEEAAAIGETLSICRAHIRSGMNAGALREFATVLNEQIVHVRPRKAQQLVAGMIAELDLAERLRRDKTKRASDALVDAAIVRVEAATRALADMCGQTVPVPPPSRKTGRTKVIAPAVVGVLALAAGVLVPTKGFGLFADAELSVPNQVPITSSDVPSTPPSTDSSVPATTTATSSSLTALPPAVALGNASKAPVAKPGVATSSTPAPQQQIRTLSQGRQVLIPTDGLDLDTGQLGDQNAPGMDISPSGDGSQINGMSHGKPKMAVVTSSAPTGPALCDTIAADAWTTPLLGLYEMRVGERICVRTNVGNYGVITLRAVPNAQTANLNIDYIAWVRS